MSSSLLRKKAREALQGKWGVAVAVGFVATLLIGGLGVSNTGSGSDNGYLSFLDHELMIMLTTVSVVMAIVTLVIGGAVRMGWSHFNIKLLRGEAVRFENLFDHFHQLGRGFCMNFMMGLFIFLWSLLFIIPGIIAGYSYALVPYLMAEYPDLGVMDAIRESKRLMNGNKGRLFCLNFSFIGWMFLSVFTLGIGNLWLTPYMEAANAAFYLDVTGRLQETAEYDAWNPVQYTDTTDPF